MDRMEDFRDACGAHPEGWQAYRAFQGGTWSIRTGHGVPLDLGGYSLPDKELDAERVMCTDVRGMNAEQLTAEAEAIKAADDVYKALKRQHLGEIVICLPNGGATDWPTWSKERLEGIGRMMLYGRR